MVVSMALCLVLLLRACNCLVEHPVIWSMPQLHGGNETEVLDALNDLRSAPEVVSFSTGRLLKQVDIYTHALLARFASPEDLRYYYATRLYDRVIPLMSPFIEEELCVDYETLVQGDPDIDKNEEAIVHVTYMAVKNETSEQGLEDALASVRSLASQMPSVVLQVTAGKNNYMRDHVRRFTHAFVAILASERVVDDFYAHPSYTKVLEDKVRPICSLVLSVDLAQYSSSSSAAM